MSVCASTGSPRTEKENKFNGRKKENKFNKTAFRPELVEG